MKTNKILQIFRHNNWAIRKDDSGGNICIFELNNMIVRCVPKIQKITEGFVIYVSYSISNPIFDKLVGIVSGQNSKYRPIVANFIRIERENISEDDIDELSSRIIELCNEINIDDEIEKISKNNSAFEGQSQLFYLAALGHERCVEKLKLYSQMPEREFSEKFVPMIKKSNLIALIQHITM